MRPRAWSIYGGWLVLVDDRAVSVTGCYLRSPARRSTSSVIAAINWCAMSSDGGLIENSYTGCKIHQHRQCSRAAMRITASWPAMACR
jgi:hypothetical protein